MGWEHCGWKGLSQCEGLSRHPSSSAVPWPLEAHRRVR